MNVFSKPFFYDPAIAIASLRNLVFQAVLNPAVDILDFPGEQGGDAERELGIPLLAGMDEIEVTRAELSLRAGHKDLDIQFTPTEPADSNGIFLVLPAPARLRKVDLTYTMPDKARVVLRPATPQGSGFVAGPPIHAHPAFSQPQTNSMYGPVLAGMSVDDFGSHKLLTLPALFGRAWLIQIGSGESADKLAPVTPPIKPIINKVTIAALPTNFRVSLIGDGAEVGLWNHPGPLLIESDTQRISFLPLAQKHLAKALKDAGSADARVTLPLRLKFHSDTGCAVEVSEKLLEARYVVKPAGSHTLSLPLRGDWVDLELAAPAGLKIADTTLRATAKLLGRELNGGSPNPPLSAPTAGLRVNRDLSVAVARPMLPVAGSAPGSLLDLVVVRLYLGTLDDAEAVMELRNDVASQPGPIVGSPLVRQLARGFSGWVEFELQKPLVVSSGQAPLWIALRANKGELLWFVDPAAAQITAPRVSSDGRKSWAVPDPLLGPVGNPLAQIFHAVPTDPLLPPPVIEVRVKEGLLAANLLTNPVSKGPGQYLSEGIRLPAAMLSRLAATPGEGRVNSTFKLFSRSVLDLKIEDLKLFYDPFQSRGGAS